MRLYEVLSLIIPSEFDLRGTPVRYFNMYKNTDFGKKQKVRPETVVVKDTKTGKIYGRRTFHQKTSGGQK